MELGLRLIVFSKRVYTIRAVLPHERSYLEAWFISTRKGKDETKDYTPFYVHLVFER